MPGNGKVFISHAHEDNERCAPLLAALDAWGVDYWFDTQRMDAGQGLVQAVQDAITNRDIFIRVGTQAAETSRWMGAEFEAFFILSMNEAPGKRLFILLRFVSDYRPQAIEQSKIYIDAAGYFAAIDKSPRDWNEESRLRREWLEGLRRALGLEVREVNRRQPRELVVDSMMRGDYATISEAISAAQPGSRIVVRPGVYKEGLVIDKPLEIVGEGKLGEVIVEAQGGEIIKFNSPSGRVSNLRLRQAGGGNWYGVYIVQGWLALEGNDITSQTGACVAVQGAVARLRHNVIHDGNVSGVYVLEKGQAILEDNEIWANGKDGVQVNSKGTVTLLRNRVHHNRRCGINVHHESNALIEDNEIIGNRTGIEVTTAGRVQARNNLIVTHSNEAVSVYNGGGGSILGNTMRDNAKSNWYIAPGHEASVVREGNIEAEA